MFWEGNRANSMVTKSWQRKGAVTVEFALVLPILLTLFVAAVDFARIYYYTQVVTDAARNGALCAANPDLADQSPYETAQEAALASTEQLSPPPTVTVGEGVDVTGYPYVDVTVSCPFSLVSKMGVGNWTISRKVRARCYPAGTE